MNCYLVRTEKGRFVIFARDVVELFQILEEETVPYGADIWELEFHAGFRLHLGEELSAKSLLQHAIPRKITKAELDYAFDSLYGDMFYEQIKVH